MLRKVQTRKEFSLSKLVIEEKKEYNSLEDKHLQAFFANPKRQKHLQRIGLRKIDRSGNKTNETKKQFQVRRIQGPVIGNRNRSESPSRSNPYLGETQQKIKKKENLIREQVSAHRKIREKEQEMKMIPVSSRQLLRFLQDQRQKYGFEQQNQKEIRQLYFNIENEQTKVTLDQKQDDEPISLRTSNEFVPNQFQWD